MPRARSTAASPVMSAAELSDALGVDRHTVVDAWVPLGCPVAREADKGAGVAWGFRLADVWRWAVDGGALSEPDDGPDGGGAGGADYEIARARKTLAQAQLAELRLETMRGRLVDVEDVADAIADEYARVRGRLMSLPASIGMNAGGMDASAVEGVAKALIAQALEELSADDATRADDDQADDAGDVGGDA